MKRATTDELLKELQKKPRFEQFAEKNKEEFEDETLAEALEKLMEIHQMTKSEVYRKANLDKGYAYEIFRGAKLPSRNKLLAICLSLGASLAETQKILRLGCAQQLHPRNFRDAAIINSIENGKNLDDTNQLLMELEKELLE